jgi:hypothetical protein
MEFNVEKYISPFIESQFPRFYQEDGPNFILFLRAYYEWMEENNNPIGESRKLFDYRDIDNTIEDFLEHFQKKYLYGIPFNVIVNKRYLLKHILDVYRSKGSIQCYKLLFRLIYDQDVDVYLPSRDILKASDGTWVVPKYVEVTESSILNSYVGKKIVGLSSKTSAVVESYIKEPINQNIISTLFLSNILPNGGSFVQGEKLIIENQNSAENISLAPTIIGSLHSVQITNGGQGFNVGDILKIVHRNSNNEIVSSGVDGLLRVSKVSRGQGALNFSIDKKGFGYTSNSMIFMYNAPSDNTGIGGDFDIGTLSYTNTIEYNTDLIADHANQLINSNTYSFPNNPSGNVGSTLASTLSFQNNIFGSINSLTNLQTGNNYTQQPNVFVRSTLISNNLPGSISYNTASKVITGSNTTFSNYFSNDSIISIKSSNSISEELIVVKTVSNNTSMTLYKEPSSNSTVSTVYKVAPVILESNFANYDPLVYNTDNSISGKNESIVAFPSSGNNIISELTPINSGKGYVDGENVLLYLYSGITTPQVVNAGQNYSNNEPLIFVGGDSASLPVGFITTNSNGNITSTSLTFQGSGLSVIPTIKVKSLHGSGAIFSTTLTEFNTFSAVQGKVIKSGLGKKQGYWSTTRGFLNSDKYVQDSYFYQDFSYQIKAAVMLDKYKDILYNTFHPSGSELFGSYYSIITETSASSILYEQSQATIS